MRRTLLLAAGVTLAALAAGLVFGQSNNQSQPVSTAVTAPAGSPGVTVQRRRNLVTLGDCVACHTQPHSAPLAGGRAVETPFGTVYSANITPDRESGICGWTADQFYRALHEGIDDEGHHLYP